MIDEKDLNERAKEGVLVVGDNIVWLLHKIIEREVNKRKSIKFFIE